MLFRGHSKPNFPKIKYVAVNRLFKFPRFSCSACQILWFREYNLKCIIDLHAAPGSQNGMEHSSSRDGTTGWPTSSDYISQSLNAIDFLASRYAQHPSLLGIELLNEPSAALVPLDTLTSYYKQGYKIVRKYPSAAFAKELAMPIHWSSTRLT
ncbi:hypothetical protein SASPL_135440 [Salvia splendens]|uniref:Glycoside hydrolase family 5 domain-containing protein n=1 Tax=Salvia splendens TaxID=180675 RepID=A0A8X8WXZ0_SALSN|nr:hypothetical protein SASPL_135440 [Salvia splendens]